MTASMTPEEAGSILAFALDVVRKGIETCENGDRPPSPPVWMLSLERRLVQAQTQLLATGVLKRNLWVLESIRDLIQDRPEHHTPRNIQVVFASWCVEGA